MPLDKNQNPNQKPSGFQPKSNGSNHDQNINAQSFDDDAAQLSRQLESTISAGQSSTYGLGYLRGMGEVAEFESGVNDCWQDYLTDEIPADPDRAKVQFKMKAARQARMEALKNGVIREGSVDIQVGKHSLSGSLATLTQQKQLGAG